MANDDVKLIARIEMRTRDLERSVARAQQVTNSGFSRIEKRAAQLSKRLSAVGSGVKGGATSFASMLGIGLGANSGKELIDSATGITNALKIAGLEGESLKRTYEALFASAQKNSVPIESMVQLFGRLSISQKELGVSQESIVTFLDKIGVALKVGGTSAATAAGALTQLSQSLGGGTVRAEEFSSMIEGAPTILQAAAAGIKEAGGSVAQLRTIMLNGELSSRALFQGIIAGSTEMEQKVSGSQLTIAQRITNLKNVLVDAAGKFNESAKAGESFGGVIEQISSEIQNVNFEKLIAQIQSVSAQFNAGTAAAADFFAAIGRISGFDGIGRDIVNMMPGDGAKRELFEGALTVTSTAGITDRINQAFEGQIEKAGQLTSDAIKSSVLGQKGGLPVETTPKSGRLPAAPIVTPISIKDYPVDPSSSRSKGGGGGAGGGGGKSSDDFSQLVARIKEHTASLEAETSAQATVNPLIDDYGEAATRAATASDLLSAAKREGMAAGKELSGVEQLLKGDFAALSPAAREQAEAMLQLANNSGQAQAASERLSQSQSAARQAMEEFNDISKDVTKGFISDLASGVKASEALGNALKKLGDRLLDMALDSLFSSKGGSALLGSLFVL